MSEITEKTATHIKLTPAMQNFIMHWGEMGTRWGINRTVAQIHALVYIAPVPLTADDISSLLAVARSTVSTGLRELQSWGIVRVVHVFGDRRDYFETINDVWEMFRIVLDERKRRELDPTLRMLHDIMEDLKFDADEDPTAKEKVKQMYDFFNTMDKVYEQVHELPLAAIISLARKGEALRSLLSLPVNAKRES